LRTSFVSTSSRSPVQTVYVSRPAIDNSGRSLGGGLLSTPTNSRSGGVTCCWGLCTFCACGRVSVLYSATGLVKLGEVALGLIAHLLLLNYGFDSEKRLKTWDWAFHFLCQQVPQVWQQPSSCSSLIFFPGPPTTE